MCTTSTHLRVYVGISDRKSLHQYGAGDIVADNESRRGAILLLSFGWKWAGLVGAVCQTITTLVSNRWIRRRFYEAFYASHVLFIM